MDAIEIARARLLRVVQCGTMLTVSGEFGSTTGAPTELVLVERNSDRDVVLVPVKHRAGEFEASIDLGSYDLDHATTLDAYFQGGGAGTGGAHRIRVARIPGMFPLVLEDVEGHGAYFTVEGGLSVSDEESRRLPVKLTLRELSFSDGIVSLHAVLETFSAAAESMVLVFDTREATSSVRIPVAAELRSDPLVSYGLHSYDIHATIDLDSVVDRIDALPSDALDPSLEFEVDWNADRFRRVRLGAPKFLQRRRIHRWVLTRDRFVAVFSPYFTFSANRLAIRVERFDPDLFRYMRRASRMSLLYRLMGRLRGTWLIGELPHKARDNGASFFRFVRMRHPERRAFYVIDPEAPDARLVADLGNVVAYRSREHVRLSLEAKRLVGTHHMEYLLPTWGSWFSNRSRGVRIFLQHGVMGVKNMVSLYGVGSGLLVDHFVVSSLFEKEMIVNDFGYRPSQVAVTGLARFDTLLDESDRPDRRLLVIPTWREWLFTKDDLIGSEYLEQWKSYLTDPRLRDELRSSGVVVTLMLHPNMRRFADLFDLDDVEVLTMGDADLQPLLKSSAMLVTDYSSVAFDFSFLHRPVLYFVFDRQRFLRIPSHLDLFDDLPGPVASTADAMVEATLDAIRSDFVVDSRYARRADRFFEFMDTNSAERIYELVRRAKRKVHVWDRLARSDFGRGVYRMYRRSNMFAPSMRVVFGVAKTIPFKTSVLFESSLGRQYAGNPRYLYEELVARGISGNAVWVLGTTVRMKDPSTRKVVRNSPAFYWRLGRARAWITDQHFPHGLKPSRATSFIQTWHGTPLKRMFFDQSQIISQSEDYTDKTVKRLAYWDVLLAQSERAAGFFRSAFGFTGQVLVSGYPRNDILGRSDAEAIVSIRARLGIPEGKRVVLYAPTFRDDERRGSHWSHRMELDLSEFARVLGDDFFLLVRTHLFVKRRLRTGEHLSDFGIDVSEYGDISELLLVTDILVTDYSSVLFDFASTGRPMVFFAYDLEHYREKLRGFYLDYEREMPGPIVRTSDEVIETVRTVDQWSADYEASLDRFRVEFCPDDDGNASERVITNLRSDGWL